MIIQLTANNSALDVTGLLSDLKPLSGNWLEFQPGMLNFRQPAQKCIFAREFRASREKPGFAKQHMVFVKHDE